MESIEEQFNKLEAPLYKSSKEIDAVAAKWNIKRYELADACGVSTTTLNAWEHKALDDRRLAIMNEALRKLVKQKKKALINAF